MLVRVLQAADVIVAECERGMVVFEGVDSIAR